MPTNVFTTKSPSNFKIGRKILENIKYPFPKKNRTFTKPLLLAYYVPTITTTITRYHAGKKYEFYQRKIFA